MTRSGVMIALAVLAVAVGSQRAWADAPGYALVVGFNGSPPGAAGDVPPPLRFADDDAMAFYQLRRQLGDHAVVLAAPDDDTRRRYPRDVDAAQPPTLETLERAMSELQAQMQADVRAGRTPVFSFFYSGHGVADADGRVALTLLDGMLTQRMLFDRILDRVPAGVIHLIVDACHADVLARARGGQAQAVALSADDVAAYLADSAPGRYLRVGMAIASSRDGAAHEWDLYQSGVFTHELISALRGAADVNGDRHVEYSELGAFLAAANREVQDPRARLLAIVKAPASAPRAPLADLSHVENSGRLTRIPAGGGAFSVEDPWGNRLVDGRPEPGFTMSVALPANERLFVREGDREAELMLRPGAEAEFGALAFQPRPLRTRGALESSLRAGLFLAQYGPGYYRGYVDRADAVAVPGLPDLGLLTEAPAAPARARRRSVVRSTLAGAAAATLAASGMFAAMSWDAARDARDGVQRASADAASRYRLDAALTAGFLVSGVVCAGAALLLGGDP